MTLNITVVTRDRIYQSADYRLSDPALSQAPQHSTKVVVATVEGSSAFITYTGVGSAGVRETRELITEWLSGLAAPGYRDIERALCDAGTRWLRRLPHGTPHTFVLTGFLRSRGHCSVISNFQRWDGSAISPIRDRMEVSPVSGGRQARIIVTGQSHLIGRLQRQRLARLAETPGIDPSRVRRMMAELNREAAALRPELISPGCYVSTEDNSGSGYQEAFGGGPARPAQLVNGVDVGKMIRPLLDGHFGAGAWTVGEVVMGRSPAQSEPTPCAPEVVDDHSSGYGLRLLRSGDGCRASPAAAAPDGTVVGSAQPHYGAPSYPCLWTPAGDVVFLRHRGGWGGSARCISAGGVAFGSSEAPDRTLRASMWPEGGDPLDLNFGHRQADIRCVNRDGAGGGWVSDHPTDGGQLHFRPAVWPVGGAPKVLHDTNGNWGEAVAVNDDGHAAVFLHEGREFIGYRWDTIRCVPLGFPPGTRGFLPTAIGPSGHVAGVGFGEGPRRTACLSDGAGSWLAMVSDDNFHAEFVAANLDTVGWDTSGPYRRPLMRRQGGPVIRLPHIRFHHTTARRIEADGSIVGTAGSDQCSHAIVWLSLDSGLRA